jgi:hypothetical protein
MPNISISAPMREVSPNRERDYPSAMRSELYEGNELYESPNRPPGEGSVHIRDGRTATLCARPLNNFVLVENRHVDSQEICEKCLAWAKDLSLVE